MWYAVYNFTYIFFSYCREYTERCMTTRLKTLMKWVSATAIWLSIAQPSTRVGWPDWCSVRGDTACYLLIMSNRRRFKYLFFISSFCSLTNYYRYLDRSALNRCVLMKEERVKKNARYNTRSNASIQFLLFVRLFISSKRHFRKRDTEMFHGETLVFWF